MPENDKDNWIKLIGHINSITDMPNWVKEKIATDEKRTDYSSLEIKTITSSYLEFLEEQINLNARGDEWSKILKSRLLALKKYENQKLVLLHVFADDGDLFLRAHPDTFEIVYWEIS